MEVYFCYVCALMIFVSYARITWVVFDSMQMMFEIFLREKKVNLPVATFFLPTSHKHVLTTKEKKMLGYNNVVRGHTTSILT